MSNSAIYMYIITSLNRIFFDPEKQLAFCLNNKINNKSPKVCVFFVKKIYEFNEKSWFLSSSKLVRVTASC